MFLAAPPRITERVVSVPVEDEAAVALFVRDEGEGCHFVGKTLCWCHQLLSGKGGLLLLPMQPQSDKQCKIFLAGGKILPLKVN